MHIISNRVKCKKCGDIIFSAHVHDFVYCSCKSVAVDGGQEYLKRTGNQSDIVELSVSVEDEVYDALSSACHWADNNNRNHLGAIFAALRNLDDLGYTIAKK